MPVSSDAYNAEKIIQRIWEKKKVSIEVLYWYYFKGTGILVSYIFEQYPALARTAIVLQITAA